MALTGSLDAERRRAEILTLARSPAGVSVEDLVSRFSVSAMTVHRDLAGLETDGLIRRFRGGAIAVPTPRTFGDRLTQRATAKKEIARKALAFVPESGRISLDASTTISTLASAIGGREGLTVCTNALQTFSILTPLEGVHPLLTGGAPEPVTGSLVGPLANRSARELRTDLFFLSAAALDPHDGTAEVSLLESEIKRTFAERTEKAVLCLDSSKLGSREAARALPLSDISVLITELDPADTLLDPYRELVEVL